MSKVFPKIDLSIEPKTTKFISTCLSFSVMQLAYGCGKFCLKVKPLNKATKVHFCSSLHPSLGGPGQKIIPFVKRKTTRPDSVLWRKPLYQQKCQQSINTKTPPTSIIKRLRTEWRRSVGVATAIQLMWLIRFMCTQPSH